MCLMPLGHLDQLYMYLFLPQEVEFNMKDQMSRMTLDQLIKTVEEMEDDIQEMKIELAKKRDR